MRLGYMATDQTGTTIHLPATDFPRKALLERLGAKSARKMYVDRADNKTVHIGYVVGQQWFTLYEVHSWEG